MARVNPIEAMLGMGAEPDESPAELAAALRGNQQMADFYAMSTLKPLNRVGRNIGDRTKRAIRQTGLFRRAAEARADTQKQRDIDNTRNKTRDERDIVTSDREYKLRRTQAARAAAAESRAQGKYDMEQGKPVAYVNQETGEQLNVMFTPEGMQTLDGAPVERQDLRGFVPFDDVPTPARGTAGFVPRKYSVQGVDVLGMHPRSGGESTYTIVGKPGDYTDATLGAAVQAEVDAAAGLARAKAGGKALGAAEGEATGEAAEATGAFVEQIGSIDVAMDALREATLPVSGPILGKVPTVTDEQAAFDTAMASLNLRGVEKAQYLRPFSEVDRDVAFTATTPNLNREPMSFWLAHRRELMRRSADASRYIDAYGRANDGARPPQKDIDRILKQYGFSLSAPSVNTEKAAIRMLIDNDYTRAEAEGMTQADRMREIEDNDLWNYGYEPER